MNRRATYIDENEDKKTILQFHRARHPRRRCRRREVPSLAIVFHRGTNSSRTSLPALNGLRRGARMSLATLILILSNASVPGAD